MTAKIRIGIDLGASKIESALCMVVAGSRHPAGDYPDTITAIVSLIGAIERGTGVVAPIRIGTPGAISSVTDLNSPIGR
jgi:hypothetical protein